MAHHHLCSVQFSHSVMSDSLWPHGLQHARPPCPSSTSSACSNSCPLAQWCPPTVSSFMVPFFSHIPSFPASGSFPVSQFFTSGVQSIGVSASASVLPMNIQDWFSLRLTWLELLEVQGTLKSLLKLRSSKHQFLGTQLSFYVSSRATRNSLLLSKDKKWYKGGAEDWFWQVGNMAEICTQNIHWVTQRKFVCFIFWKWWTNEETRAVMPSDLEF